MTPSAIAVLILHTKDGQRNLLAQAARAAGLVVVRDCSLEDGDDVHTDPPPDLVIVEGSPAGLGWVERLRTLPRGNLPVVLLATSRRHAAQPLALLDRVGADDLVATPIAGSAAQIRLAAAIRLVRERRSRFAGDRQTVKNSGTTQDSAPDVPGEPEPGWMRRQIQRLAGARWERAGGRHGVISAAHDPVPPGSVSPDGTMPSRGHLLASLGTALERVHSRPDLFFAVLLIDLDRFKQVNFDLGHAAGDTLLAAVAQRLTSQVRSSDSLTFPDASITHLGGDEFIMLLENLNDARDATRVAKRVLDALEKPFHLADRDVFLSASIGIAWSSPEVNGPEDLFRNAELAMYRAKDQGRACYAVCEQGLGGGDNGNTLMRQAELRRALQNNLLVIRLQPIVSLRTGRLAGFEALSRWPMAAGGEVSPAEFIPLAEESGLIHSVDRNALHLACQQLRSWAVRYRHARLVPIAVNLSGRHLTKPDLVMEIDRTLRSHGLDGRLLRLEITESTLMDGIRFADDLFRQLRTMNISVSLDDFGTGYSSLVTLRRFAIDALKIDGGFVARMLEDEESREIVRAIIDLARNLTKDAVAEGVETHSQLAMLREMGCPAAQGFLFAPPLDSEAATALLEAHLHGERMVSGTTGSPIA